MYGVATYSENLSSLLLPITICYLELSLQCPCNPHHENWWIIVSPARIPRKISCHQLLCLHLFVILYNPCSMSKNSSFLHCDWYNQSSLTWTKNPFGAFIRIRFKSSDFLTISNVSHLPDVVETATKSTPCPCLSTPMNCPLNTLIWKLVWLSLHNCIVKKKTDKCYPKIISIKSLQKKFPNC